MKIRHIPQTDLDMLEEARKELHEIIGDDILMQSRISNVSGVMWRLAHKNYPLEDAKEKEDA